MRDNLKPLEGRRDWFVGRLAGVVGGKFENPELAATLLKFPKSPIALIHSIALNSEPETILTDHVWIAWYGALDFANPYSGDWIVFLGTVKVYAKGKSELRDAFGGSVALDHDYGIKDICWVQPASHNPEPRPMHMIPESQQVAEQLLNEHSILHLQDRGRYPIATCLEWGARLSGWNSEVAQAFRELVLEGWCDPQPGSEDYWVERSPSLKKLSEVYNSRLVSNLVLLAAIVNGSDLRKVAAFSLPQLMGDIYA